MPILEGRQVTCSFGGLRAVAGVDFAVAEGDIFGIIGPNGAGKTTLLNLISRIFPLTAGEIRFRGQPIHDLPPHRVARLGIARTFQVVKPFARMTARENVAIGAMFGHGGAGTSAAFRSADEALEFVGLAFKAGDLVVNTTLAERKKLELARALAMDPVVLLLDEVMAGLNPTEVLAMMDLVRQVNRRGVTVVIIEHVMQAMMALAGTILVLQHGQRIALGRPDEIVADSRVIQAYLGERYARRET